MIFLVLLVGLGLRLVNLDQSLWLDEAITASALRNNSLTGIITNFSPGDFHPPLYYLMLKPWTDIFGYSEAALRLPSVFFSLGVGYFIYLIGKGLSSKRVGLTASLLWVVNPLAVYYAQEARMYSLVAFAVSAAVYFFLQKKWFGYLAFFILALASDYLPIFMLPVFLLLARDRKHFALVNSVILVPLGLWLPVLYRQIMAGFTASSSSWGNILGRFELKALPLTLVKFIVGRISLDNKWLYALTMFPVTLVYLAAMCKARIKLLWLWLLVPLTAGLGVSLIVPIYSYFRFLFVLPAFVLLLAVGAENSRWKLAVFVTVSLFSLWLFNTNRQFQRENWREAGEYIQIDPGIILMPSLAQSDPLKYYYPEAKVFDRGNVPILQDSRKIYLIRYVQEIFDPNDGLRIELEMGSFARTQEASFNGVLIWKYENRN